MTALGVAPTPPPQRSASYKRGASYRSHRPSKYAVGNDVPVEIIESGPSVAAQLASLSLRLTVRSALSVLSHVPHWPWPFGIVDSAAKALLPVPGAVRARVNLPNASAQLVRAPEVLPADGNRSIILYMHGGAFMTCGVNSHSRVSIALSEYADAPVLVVDYRLIPQHTIDMALDDCYDAYQWLRYRGYQPDQIVLAGDSAGGYLALALAQRLAAGSTVDHEDGTGEGEVPAALVVISPLLQLEKDPKLAHPNANTDAVFPPRAFEALVGLVAKAAADHGSDEDCNDVYEPLDHIEPGLPPTLIHVSGSEVLLHDAQLAARRLAAAGVPTEIHLWPGQVHDFQLAGPLIPEAQRSLQQVGEFIRKVTS